MATVDKQTSSEPAATPVAAPAVVAAPAAAAAAVAETANAYMDKVKDTASNVTEKVKNFTSTNPGMVMAVVILGIAVAFATAFALYWVISRTILNQQSYLLAETKVPILATQITQLNGTNIPNAFNGRRQTVCFWVYIYDINKYAGSYRHVFHRGKPGDNFVSTGPYVRMDKDTNKISVTWSLMPVSVSGGSAVTKNYYLGDTDKTNVLTDDDKKWDFFRQAHGITFDYVPLQRWVHLAVVVNEDQNGGTMTAYLDGELVKSVNANTVLTAVPGVSPEVTPTFQIQNVDLNTKGNVFVGGAVGNPMGPGFSGMVSKIEFFNFDMNATDVYTNYRKGPIDNLLAKMGLPAYGLQSPVYRIGA